MFKPVRSRSDLRSGDVAYVYPFAIVLLSSVPTRGRVFMFECEIPFVVHDYCSCKLDPRRIILKNTTLLLRGLQRVEVHYGNGIPGLPLTTVDLYTPDQMRITMHQSFALTDVIVQPNTLDVDRFGFEGPFAQNIEQLKNLYGAFDVRAD